MLIMISEELMTLLSREGGKRQIIGQSELIPCNAAQIVWKNRMRGKRILLYIDDEAARYGAPAPPQDSAWIINEYWSKEAAHETNTWMREFPQRAITRTSLRETGSRSSPTWESRLARSSCREGTRRNWSNDGSGMGRSRGQGLSLLAREYACARRVVPDYSPRSTKKREGKLCGSDRVSGRFAY